jgi:magnesium and cobalt exporter, CNNM family
VLPVFAKKMTLLFFDVVIIVLLVLLNGFFAMSELSVVSSRRGRLKQMAKEGSRGARAAITLVDDPGRFLPTVQIGITMIGVLAGAFSGATLAREIEVWLSDVPVLGPFANGLAIAIVVIGITYLSLIFGELVPKRIALTDAERVAALVSRVLALLSRLTAPLVWFLRHSSDAVLRMLGLPTTRQVTITDEEVRGLVAEGAAAGVFEPAERDMIDGVMRLADRPVRSIMTPRVDVVWLDLSDSEEEIRKSIIESARSRFPVGRGEIEAVEGVVHAKDLLDRMMAGRPFDLAACIRQPLFIHEGTPVLKLLDLFRSSTMHIALVVDEYGGFEGVVTTADILAAIAGEFQDDEGEGESAAVRRDDGSWLIDGSIDIDQLERYLDRRDLKSNDDYHTLAGFVLWELGHLPKIGERVDWKDLRFEVVDMDGRRIDRVLVSQIPGDHPANERG